MPACAAEPTPAPAAASPALDTDEQKTLYALGMMMSRQLGPLGLTEADLALVESGLQDGILGRESKVDIQVYGAKIQEFAQGRASASAAVEKTKAATYLEEQAALAGAVKTDSGLIYIETLAGTGDSPAATDTVKVHYHGTLRDGSVFDSSVERGQPASFPLNRVIPCWTEGVQKMKVGGKAKLVCPPEIAYGDQGAPPRIPPGAALSFEVELLEIVK
ncbi:MAG: FKBP-type peptidyl-prolyl cis-trans isomerase [Thermoanaerobaculia bacterium]|nr:FKBP-type peptidyl-prolyl cis-trans isomerase [Thermoanaerobaculia bacterium]